MNGPEHYRAAESLLTFVNSPAARAVHKEAEVIAEAQVHATLALSAAVANLNFDRDAVAPLAEAPGPWSSDHKGDGVTWKDVLR